MLSKLMNLQGIKALSQPVSPSVSASVQQSTRIFCVKDLPSESTESVRVIKMHAGLDSSHDTG